MRKEIDKAVEGNRVGTSQQAHKTLKDASVKFKKFHRSFLAFANNLLEGKPIEADGGAFTDLVNMPQLDELSTDEERELVVLALLVQNAHHAKNGDRVDAVVKATYAEIKNAEDAIKYCEKVLTDELVKQVSTKFADIVRDYEKKEAVINFRQALEAPDFFIAVAILQRSGLTYGKGDFKRALELLASEKSASFRDIAKKLVVFKNGCLFKKGTVCEDASQPLKAMTPDMVNSAEALPIFADKKSNVAKDTDNCINSKLVFRVWATQVYDKDKKDIDTGASNLTQAQLENIFPEFAHKLQLYAKCCDETGKIVKNKEYYATYKSKMHQYSRRGGLANKDAKQKEVRKQFSDKKKANLAQNKK